MDYTSAKIILKNAGFKRIECIPSKDVNPNGLFLMKVSTAVKKVTIGGKKIEMGGPFKQNEKVKIYYHDLQM